MDFRLNKNEDIALHKQIAHHLRQMVESGEIAYGEKLTPERNLAEHLGVSRGTVKKAYETLVAQGYLKAEQGAGTYASYAPGAAKKKERVDGLIDDLREAGYSFNEIEALTRIRILHKKEAEQSVKIAAVDCNPEALDIIRLQFAAVGDVECMAFLLKDVLRYSAPQEAFEAFDVVFTTATHFEELKNFIPGLGDKIVKTALSTDRESVVKLAGIKDPKKTAVLTKSPRFAEIVSTNLRGLNLEVPTGNFAETSAFRTRPLDGFLEDKTHLVLPPLFALDLEQPLEKEVFRFHRRGGEIVTFNYAIEQGSLFYIEKKIEEKVQREKDKRNN